jgi:dTDP-4-amino-4,6-dideoxygalactose transaminase
MEYDDDSVRDAYEELQRTGGGFLQPADIEAAKVAAAAGDAARAGSLSGMTSNTTLPNRADLSKEDLVLLPSEQWPTYTEAEIATVGDILRSGWVNQLGGTHVYAFQDEYDAFIGHGRRSIAMANGSVTLDIILRAYGIGPGDEVIVTPRTFIASVHCVLLAGATPVFADVDLDSGNITPESVAAVLTPRTKAVIPVHVAGWMADMPGFMELAREHDLLIVEDAAHAHGAEIDGIPAGAYGQAASFSFCREKIMTTGGEGGLAVFEDPAKFEWAWAFKDHGKNRETYFAPADKPGFKWVHDSVGTNWRMLETSASIGRSQLARLLETRTARTERAMIWHDAIQGIDGIRMPMPPANYTHAFYKLYAYVDRGDATLEIRDRILARMAERGLTAMSGICSEVYLEKALEGIQPQRLPNAKQLGDASIMFEVHPTLDLERTRARAAVFADIVRDELG